MKKIFIDAGHGGSDPGAIGNGLREKDINLAIALKLRQVLSLEYEGHTIKLSRNTDQTLSLKQRTDMANQWGADYLISIHINAGGGVGFESFTYSGNYARKMRTNQLRIVIHDAIIEETGFRDRGKKEANFHMLRESSMCAVLTESGFVDHHIDANKLKRETFINKIALGHAKGLAKAIGLTAKSNLSNQGATSHIIRKGDTLWALAQSYETTLDSLIALNTGIQPKYLQIGQKIRVR